MSSIDFYGSPSRVGKAPLIVTFTAVTSGLGSLLLAGSGYESPYTLDLDEVTYRIFSLFIAGDDNPPAVVNISQTSIAEKGEIAIFHVGEATTFNYGIGQKITGTNRLVEFRCNESGYWIPVFDEAE